MLDDEALVARGGARHVPGKNEKGKSEKGKDE
jgi:hypothetical protein